MATLRSPSKTHTVLWIPGGIDHAGSATLTDVIIKLHSLEKLLADRSIPRGDSHIFSPDKRKTEINIFRAKQVLHWVLLYTVSRMALLVFLIVDEPAPGELGGHVRLFRLTISSIIIFRDTRTALPLCVGKVYADEWVGFLDNRFNSRPSLRSSELEIPLEISPLSALFPTPGLMWTPHIAGPRAVDLNPVSRIDLYCFLNLCIILFTVCHFPLVEKQGLHGEASNHWQKSDLSSYSRWIDRPLCPLQTVLLAITTRTTTCPSGEAQTSMLDLRMTWAYHKKTFWQSFGWNETLGASLTCVYG
jgi:hypothetical protein